MGRSVALNTPPAPRRQSVHRESSRWPENLKTPNTRQCGARLSTPQGPVITRYATYLANSAYRIDFLKTSIEVDNQKLASFREKENCRLQQIARVQRDFNLVKFQIHESAQEERNAQLADEVERQQEALEYARSAFKEELDLSKERYEFVEKKLARKISEAENILEEKTGLEVRV